MDIDYLSMRKRTSKLSKKSSNFNKNKKNKYNCKNDDKGYCRVHDMNGHSTNNVISISKLEKIIFKIKVITTKGGKTNIYSSPYYLEINEKAKKISLPGKNIISTAWNFATKRNCNNFIYNNIACFVARGFSQKMEY